MSSTDSFANSLDPDQDRHNVGPDLDPNRLALYLKTFKKLILKIKSVDDEKSMQITQNVKSTEHEHTTIRE